MKKQIIVVLIIALLIIIGLSGCFEQEQTEQTIDKLANIPTGNMTITSTAFNNSEPIPLIYAKDVGNIPPPLTFSNVSDDAKSLVLIMDDPDASEEPWIHWTVWNIPSTKSGFAENEEIIYPMGTNSWGNTEYDGPSPPSGTTHHYYFRLYALNTSLNLDVGSYTKKLQTEIEKYGIEKAELMGTYTG